MDTHTLSWLLTKDKKLTDRAKNSFRQASIVFVPIIVLMELLYMLKKKRKASKFTKILARLKKEERFSFISLDFETAEKCLEYAYKLEMHDNIIVSTARNLNLPLVTKDTQIKKIYQNTIW